MTKLCFQRATRRPKAVAATLSGASEPIVEAPECVEAPEWLEVQRTDALVDHDQHMAYKHTKYQDTAMTRLELQEATVARHEHRICKLSEWKSARPATMSGKARHGTTG